LQHCCAVWCSILSTVEHAIYTCKPTDLYQEESGSL
jgi:hypothetical protein